MNTLRKVPQRLQHQRFWFKERKYQFFTKRLNILGYILTWEGLSADPLKVLQIFDFAEPRDTKLSQVLIGIEHYLSKFLLKLASTTAILTHVRGTTCPCRCTDTHLQAFNLSKVLINDSQVMKPCDNASEEPKYLICDASDIGLGSWWGQGKVDRIRPARFHSRKVNPAQLSYPTV